MKQGRSINDLTALVNDQRKIIGDMVAPTSLLSMVERIEDTALFVQDSPFGLTDHAHTQLAEYVGMPIKYYRACRAERDKNNSLLKDHVNYWLKKQSSDHRLIRTLGAQVRGILSPSYRIVDNWELLKTLLPRMIDAGMEIRSCELTETKMYVKAIFPSVTMEIKKGDIVCAGLMIENSEVGLGGSTAIPFTEVLACTNGAIWRKFGRMFRHYARDAYGGNGSVKYLTEDTRQKVNQAVIAELGDVVNGLLSESREIFYDICNDMKEAAGQPLDNVQESIKYLTANEGVLESEGDDILKYLISGGDITRWGLSQAVTRRASDAETYERATELEALGAKIIHN